MSATFVVVRSTKPESRPELPNVPCTGCTCRWQGGEAVELLLQSPRDGLRGWRGDAEHGDADARAAEAALGFPRFDAGKSGNHASQGVAALVSTCVVIVVRPWISAVECIIMMSTAPTSHQIPPDAAVDTMILGITRKCRVREACLR